MPSTGQTRTVDGKTQYWWGTTWHTVPPPAGSGTASGGSAPVPAPAAPAPQAPPFDANLANRLGLLQQRYGDQNAAFDAQEGQVKSRYGLDDGSDPFSQLAQLKQAFEARRNSSTTSLSARGLLYSGALNNAQTGNQQFYDRSYDTLRKAQTDALARIAQQRAQTKFNFESGKLDAQDAATSTAVQSRPDSTDFQSPLATSAPKPPALSGAATRRASRRSIGITDIRTASASQIRRARSLGYL